MGVGETHIKKLGNEMSMLRPGCWDLIEAFGYTHMSGLFRALELYDTNRSSTKLHLPSGLLLYPLLHPLLHE
jgi:hypothetical protein